jgi:hypothetical protein
MANQAGRRSTDGSDQSLRVVEWAVGTAWRPGTLDPYPVIVCAGSLGRSLPATNGSDETAAPIRTIYQGP